MSPSRRPGTATTLRHNPLNAVTTSVERITREDGTTYIRKELREPAPAAHEVGGPGVRRVNAAGMSQASRAGRPGTDVQAGRSGTAEQAGRMETGSQTARSAAEQAGRSGTAEQAGRLETGSQAGRSGAEQAGRSRTAEQADRLETGSQAGRSGAERQAGRAGAGAQAAAAQAAGVLAAAVEPWAASVEARHWNYWRREVDVYLDDEVRAQLRGTGLVLPGAEVEEVAGGAVLYLEDVAGRAGTEFGLEDHAALARACGRWQARPAVVRPWTSVGFLRQYSTTRQVPWDLLYDDAAWRQPLVADNWPAGLRESWERMVAQRDELLTIVEQAPRAGCHLDLWVCNAIRRADGEIALLDWAFCGDWALGEDIGNHIPDAVFDLFWQAERLPELAETCIDSYLEGLREGGWRGEADVVRRAVMAAAVKYAWLLPGLLGRASDSSHKAYHQEADSQYLFQQRGIALKFVADWCAEGLKGRR